MLYESCKLGRYTMYRKIEEWISLNALNKGNGKTVGGISPLIICYPQVFWEITNIMPYRNFEELEWEVRDIISEGSLKISDKSVDIEKLPWEDESLDIIMSDQVLEHIPHPWIASKEMLRVLKPNGIIIITVASLVKWHGPSHYFSFQKQGLESLFKDGLREYELGSWGNKIGNLMLNYNKSINLIKVKDNSYLEKIANKNDELSPYVVWLCGRKLRGLAPTD